MIPDNKPMVKKLAGYLWIFKENTLVMYRIKISADSTNYLFYRLNCVFQKQITR